MTNESLSADTMVQLIKQIVQDELNKRDQVVVGTVRSYDSSTNTYGVCVEPDDTNEITEIRNSTRYDFRIGDHVYIMKVRNQFSQAFILGSVGDNDDALIDVTARLDRTLIAMYNMTASGIAMSYPVSLPATASGEN